ncbi:MAG: hypothetical protein H6774_00155 [Pseudomonadales bacterium]|nr:hypothetical protein [Candidatus Woesebacteria bacterium]MCB9801487.1 hypothetical protein [Pseudomonadales bacterium]
MIDLTPRQVQILRAIIEEFIQTAEPVGSDTIDKKYSIGVSPATIRNEMVQLTKQGYLNKGHTSAGRLPTPLAMKLYVNELMKEKELTVADEVSAKEKIWKWRQETDQLIAAITKDLAQKSHALGMAVSGGNKLYHSGYANLLEMPEFYDIQVMRNVLTLVEQAQELDELFERVKSHNPVQVVYGHELGNEYLEDIGLIFTKLTIKDQPCYVAVLGSHRFDYEYIIPMMKYMRGLIETVVEE